MLRVPSRPPGLLPALAATCLLTLGACDAPGRGRPAAIDEGRRKELAARWSLYLSGDPKWPAAREEWMAGPEEERDLLLDNLLIELLRDDAASRGSGTSQRSARARRELAWFGADAVPLLEEAMRGLARRDAVDVVAVDRVGLALVELRATTELAALCAAPDRAGAGAAGLQLQLAAIRALAHLDEPAATAALVERLESDPSWQVRGAAAEVLRRRAGSIEVRAALFGALSDPDGFVRAQAVRALVAEINPAEEGGALLRALSILLQDPSATTRAAAAEALALFAFDPRVELALTHALVDRDLAVVQKAALALRSRRTPAVQRALVDALERAVKARADGLVSELLLVLESNVGARPRNLNPGGWRELLARRQGSR